MALLFLLSWSLTGLFRQYAINYSLLDIPNERSSHSDVTPRGGGIAIVISAIIGIFLMWWFQLLPMHVFAALSGAGILVAIVGFVDDHVLVSARSRLVVHFIAAIWLLINFGGMPVLIVFNTSYDLGWLGHILAAVIIVWFLNLYNFMDGIDGIAGAETITATLVIGTLAWLVYKNELIAGLNFILLFSVLGFLLWNFPKAKIFMGDSGSGFLGILFAGLTLLNSHLIPQMLWVSLIMYGVFIIDATYTFSYRLIKGEKLHIAHRGHAYQIASRRYDSHTRVTIGIILINLGWLLPWSYAVSMQYIDGALAMVMSYIPLIGIVSYFKAGSSTDDV